VVTMPAGMSGRLCCWGSGLLGSESQGQAWGRAGEGTLPAAHCGRVAGLLPSRARMGKRSSPPGAVQHSRWLLTRRSSRQWC
jgi:hypothetical protein